MKKIKLIIKNLKYFIPLLVKVNPLIIIIMIFNSLLSSVMGLSQIIFTERLISFLIEKRDKNEIIMLIFIFLGFLFLLRILINILSNINQIFSQRATFRIDEMFNNKISSIDYYNIENPEFCDKINFARKSLKEYSGGIYSIIDTLSIIIENVFMLFGIISIVLVTKGYYIVLVCFICLIINTIIYSKYQNINQNYNTFIIRMSRKQSYYNKGVYEFTNQKHIRLFNMQNLISKKSDELNDKIFYEQSILSKKLSKLDSYTHLITYILKKLIIILILLMSYLNNISLLILLYNSIQTFDDCSSQLVYAIKQYYKDCIYQDNFIEFMNTKSIYKDGKCKLDKVENIEFKDVCFKYPRTDCYILKNLNFSFSCNEKVSLVGVNGSGKTTIIKLLCKFFPVTEGEILINGININNYIHDEYMDKIAVVFQDFKIISFTIEDNICILETNKNDLYKCLEKVNSLEFVNNLHNKENTYINKWFDKNGIQFSGGELQKFAIARALYKSSEIIVLDEPTSSLDSISEANIYSHINDIVGKKSTIFISHRLASCIFCDKIFVLDNGRIIETGTHDKLMKYNSKYARMFNAQAEYYKH